MVRAGEAGKYQSLIQRYMGLGMLGWIQVTPGSENIFFCRNNGRKVIEVIGMSGYPPRAEIGWQDEKGG